MANKREFLKIIHMCWEFDEFFEFLVESDSKSNLIKRKPFKRLISMAKRSRMKLKYILNYSCKMMAR